MLCSHGKKFVYLKTIKTAGTSVEIFFERFCCHSEGYQERHNRNEYIGDAGIIGYRGADPSGVTFYNHMPAREVREKLGSEIFDSYFKFCVVRNPFDKVVSMFWFQLPHEERERLTTAEFASVKDKFNAFVLKRDGLPVDRHVYVIDGAFVPDFYIRYENLLDDMRRVCERLKIDFTPSDLGQYKIGMRTRPENFREYYDAEGRAVVEEAFAYELEKFGYSFG